MSLRMKHAYPRAMRLVEQRLVDVIGLASHRFPLQEAAAALQLNAEYQDHLIKVIIESEP